MAAYLGEAQARQGIAQSERDASELEVIAELMDKLSGRVGGVEDNAARLAGKLMGEVPVSISSHAGQTAKPGRSGLLGRIRDQIDNANEILDRADQHTNRLRNAI